MKCTNKVSLKNISYPYCSVHDISSVNYIDKHVLDMKMYWYDYTPSVNTSVSSDSCLNNVFTQHRNIIGRSIRCSFPYIVFKPWCVDKHKLVLYYENIDISNDIEETGSVYGLYLKNSHESMMYYDHLRVRDISCLNESLSKSLEIAAKIIRELGLQTLNPYRDNWFAYEIKNNKLNLLHVVSDVCVNRERFVDLLLEMSSPIADYSVNDLFKHINLERYVGKIYSNDDSSTKCFHKVLGIPLPYTNNDNLPLLFQPRDTLARLITSKNEFNEHDLTNHFRKQINDNTKIEFGNCWNYTDV